MLSVLDYVKLETLEREVVVLRRKKGWLQLNVGKLKELMRKKCRLEEIGGSRVSLVMNVGLSSQALTVLGRFASKFPRASQANRRRTDRSLEGQLWRDSRRITLQGGEGVGVP